MSLTPSATVVLGSLRYEAQIAGIAATLVPLPGVNSCTVIFPAGVKLTAVPGDDASLELDGGDGRELVMTGKVRRIRRALLRTEVTVADAGEDLARFRPRATFERQNARDVIRSLSSAAGAEAASLDIDLPLASYVAHQRRTAGEHIANLAKLAGAAANVNAEGALEVLPVPAQPEVALLHGREVIDCHSDASATPEAARFMIGNGPAGAADEPGALRHSLKPLPGNAPKSGAAAIWAAAPILRTPAAALTASQAADADAAAGASRVTARCFLQPILRAGMVAEIQGLPNDLAGGPWLLTRVVHRLDPHTGGTTAFEGVSAKAGGGLFASALSDAGSFL